MDQRAELLARDVKAERELSEVRRAQTEADERPVRANRNGKTFRSANQAFKSKSMTKEKRL